MNPLSGTSTIGFFFIVMALALLAPHLSMRDANRLAAICGGFGLVALFVGLRAS